MKSRRAGSEQDKEPEHPLSSTLLSLPNLAPVTAKPVKQELSLSRKPNAAEFWNYPKPHLPEGVVFVIRCLGKSGLALGTAVRKEVRSCFNKCRISQKIHSGICLNYLIRNYNSK